MPWFDPAKQWRKEAQAWMRSGRRMGLLVLRTRKEVELAVPALEDSGWWLDKFAVSDVGVAGETVPRKNSEATARYHLLFRKTPRASD